MDHNENKTRLHAPQSCLTEENQPQIAEPEPEPEPGRAHWQASPNRLYILLSTSGGVVLKLGLMKTSLSPEVLHIDRVQLPAQRLHVAPDLITLARPVLAQQHAHRDLLPRHGLE